MNVIGLDIGTTGCKAVVFDEDGAIQGYGFREYGIDCSEPAMAEQDAEAVWRYTLEVLGKAIDESGTREFAALCPSVQGDAIIAVDSGFNALYPALLGMDYRSEPQARECGQNFGSRRLFDLTGMRPHPMNSIVKALWLRRNRPSVYEKTWKITTYADFILGKLGAEPVIDHTMASRTMAFDLKSGAWSDEILGGCGIGAGLLSRPVPSGTVVGTVSAAVASRLGINDSMKLVAGGHDQTCAAIGAGVIVEGRAAASTGTAEVMSAAFDKPVLNDSMFEGYYPCYMHARQGMFFTFSLNHIGGLLFKWYRDTLAGEETADARRRNRDPYDLIVERMPAGPSPLMVLPHFNGSGTPWCDTASRGAVVGLTMSSTRHQVAKAILESLTYELRINMETMQRAGIAVEELVAVGGGAKSPLWLQLKADILRRPVRTLKVREAACLGAGLLAAAACGIYGSLEEGVARAVLPDRTFEPGVEADAYRERYAAYRRLYPALREFNRTYA